MISLYVIIVTVVNALFLWVVYHKLSAMIHLLKREVRQCHNNTISQIESLFALHTEIRPERALPSARGWAASPDILHLLILTAQQRRPRTILECSSGVSTLVLAACLRNLGAGHVYSLEHDVDYAEKSRQLLALHGLSDWATIVYAPLTALSLHDWKGSWYCTDQFPAHLHFDMLVIDGPPDPEGKSRRYPALPVLHDRLNIGASIFLDDTIRTAEAHSLQRWLAEFPDLQTVDVPECEKGCALLIKREI